MKKPNVTRYDLDRVYWLGEYQKTVAYAEQNISIDGVKAQLDSLRAEKKRYSDEVSAFAEAERNTERLKYEAYKKWAAVAQISKWVFLAGLIGSVVIAILSGHHNGNLLGDIFAILVLLAFFGGLPTAIVSFLGRAWCARQYQQYINGIASRFDSLGSTFKERSKSCYNAIDNLYLNTLDATQRELVLMRREQAAQSQRLLQAEKERQRLQEKLIVEQQKTRATQEELLAIERAREERYKKSRW